MPLFKVNSVNYGRCWFIKSAPVGPERRHRQGEGAGVRRQGAARRRLRLRVGPVAGQSPGTDFTKLLISAESFSDEFLISNFVLKFHPKSLVQSFTQQ
jgi:hypothetical protein